MNAFVAMGRFLVFGIVFVTFGLTPLSGHGAYDEEIQRTNERIAADPGNAENWFHRGYLNYLHGDWMKSLLDLDKADGIAPGKYPVDLVRGLAWLAGGKIKPAVQALDQFVTTHPNNPDGHAARARLMLLLEDHDAAVDEFRQALANTKYPEPDLYIETANALIGQEHPEEAVRILQSGMLRLGEIPSLAGKALDLELSLGMYSAALSRVAALQRSAPRPEPWMAKTAGISAQAGRLEESRAAWMNLREHLLGLPNLERGSHSMSILLEQAGTALEALDVGASASSTQFHLSSNNTPPTVALTAPDPGKNFDAPASVCMTAEAADADGSIGKVESYADGAKVGESDMASDAFFWNGGFTDNYSITAMAIDDGGMTISGSVGIIVQTAPLEFSENFDSMGTGGTSPPTGWSIKNGDSGSTSTTWTDSVPIAGSGANSVASMVAAAGSLTVSHAPTLTNNGGYNAEGATTSDRVLATSPTHISGDAIQWQLTNSSPVVVTGLRMGYDIRRYTSVFTANELPGYWLFYSLDSGTTWTNVSVLNPTLSGGGVQVPNTVGVTTVLPTEFTLTNGWAPGATLLMRWVDDNAVATSPDQIVGLDNVTLAAAGALVGDAPVVNLTTPLSSDSFISPATVNLAADASDTDGTITKVEFYNGSAKLGESSSAPYTYTWAGVAAGSYGLTARAIDNDANVTLSGVTHIVVNPTPGSGTLTRAAYLQQAGPTTMTVRWRSSQSITGRVKFGDSAVSLTTTVDESSAMTDHEVTLTGLTADTKYFYSIGSSHDTLAGGDSAHHFTTSPVPGTVTDTRVWVLGDAGTGNSSQTSVRDAFYDWTGNRDPNLVLELGDNAYNSGLDNEFQAKVFDIYGSLMKRVPFWSCLGNHETGQATAFVDTYPYFGVYTFPKAGECGGVASGTEHYYSFDFGNIHLISLDSMTADRSANGAMATWLTSDLAAVTSPWIICIFHHPPYTKGSHNSDTETELIQMRTNILPILEAGGVDLVLSGHSHCYERSYLLDGYYGTSETLMPAMKKDAGDGRPAGTGAYIKPLTGPRDHFGAVYAVAGSSGQTGGGSLNHPAHFISLDNAGSLVLDVTGNRLDATFIRDNGSLPDTFTMIKQGAADSDHDGMPDEYEIIHGLNRFSAADAILDSDGDGLSNLQEFLLGLNPGMSDRYLWSTIHDPLTGKIDVVYPTLVGRNYQVDWSADLLDWHMGSSLISGDGTTRSWTDDGSVTGSNPGSGGQRFYRVQVTGAP